MKLSTEDMENVEDVSDNVEVDVIDIDGEINNPDLGNIDRYVAMQIDRQIDSQIFSQIESINIQIMILYKVTKLYFS